MVKVYIDNIYKTNINITKYTKLSEIRVLCQSYFQEDKNYYFNLENDTLVKNDSALIADILKKEYNKYKIYLKSEVMYIIIVSVFLNEV